MRRGENQGWLSSDWVEEQVLSCPRAGEQRLWEKTPAGQEEVSHVCRQLFIQIEAQK